jgi:hypothetical protein
MPIRFAKAIARPRTYGSTAWLDRFTSVSHQTTESLVFFSSEMYRFALLLYKVAIGVERNITHYADQI